MKFRMLKNNRGVALLIALLVTALLLALVFEFAYATRVSVRAAANFRDSQRAWFLARSGVNFVGKVLVDDRQQGRLQDNLEQKEWQVVPVISTGDAELRVRWEDEAGKIDLSQQDPLRRLFEVAQVSSDVDERIAERVRERGRFQLVSELHEIMTDEDYFRIQDSVTPFAVTGGVASINTAPINVLRTAALSALGKDGKDERGRDDRAIAEDILNRRSYGPFKNNNDIVITVGALVAGKFNETSDYFKIHSHATVGEYTRQVEAVIQRSATGFTVLSWRSL